MKRALVAAAATIAGLAALLGYKSGTPPRRLALGTAPTPGTSGAGPGAGAQAPTSGEGNGGPDNSASPSTNAPTPTPSTSAPGAGTASGGNRTVTGADVSTRYGDVQVRAVLSGGRLTDVQALTLPQDRQRSAFISSQAAPILRQEALAAQGAQIDIVSGATYTSDGYAQSLQAALDAARQ